jgi:60 kDa SS-A/Ro ribonucleoprotein
MRTNVKVITPVFTHEGAPAVHANPKQQLRRAVMACLLWEKQFYEDGQSIAQRIATLVPQVKVADVAAIAIEARNQMNLRHVPLLLVREMARHESHKALVSDALTKVVQRADEMGEFISLYWLDGKRPLSAQVKTGLRNAFGKFDAYQLAKYDRESAVRLLDVMRLVHPRPKDDAQSELWRNLRDGKLETPYTWETELSKQDGRSKREKWTELLTSGKMGDFAVLRNLRNAVEAGVPDELIRYVIATIKGRNILPFRYIAAARYAMQFEPELETKLLHAASLLRLPGKTRILVDVSGSMGEALSGKSDMRRLDAACGVAMVAREACEACEVWTFSQSLTQVPPRRGFALRDAIVSSQPHGGTLLGRAVEALGTMSKMDRLIVVTDEQSADRVGESSANKSYMINVASAQNGVGYGKWHRINGFSEAVLHYIMEYESNPLQQVSAQAGEAHGFSSQQPEQPPHLALQIS